MIPYRMLFIIDVFMIINHYVTYNRLNNLTIYNKRKTCTDIITCLFKQKNFPFIHFQSPFSLIRSSTSLLDSSISSKVFVGVFADVNVFSELLFPQYKHICVKGEYTLPHFGQIHPCCPNILLKFTSFIITRLLVHQSASSGLYPYLQPNHWRASTCLRYILYLSEAIL